MKKKAAEDISVLENIFDIKNFEYVNVTQSEQLEKIMHRWPLITELEAHKKTMENK